MDWFTFCGNKPCDLKPTAKCFYHFRFSAGKTLTIFIRSNNQFAIVYFFNRIKQLVNIAIF